jgi:hypothetical protein
LKVYAARLAQYAPEDIKAACTRLSLTRRAEGETAFPDLATVDETVQQEGRNRRIRTVERERKRLAAEEERDRKAHPEKYVAMGELVGDYYQTKGIEFTRLNDVSDPHNRIMAALSAGLAAGQEYEPKVLEEILAWRQTQ